MFIANTALFDASASGLSLTSPLPLGFALIPLCNRRIFG
ncbi:hypothetical protein SynRS9902_01471 [Synechococcus sp. RS9902]|nr:hypothetical protein SynRS9902_01471 [Synechococcus sp. RS9902]